MIGLKNDKLYYILNYRIMLTISVSTMLNVILKNKY